MKINKKLQAYANKSFAPLKNDGFLSELKNRTDEKETAKNRISLYSVIAGSATAIIVAAILLCVCLIDPAVAATEKPAKKNYLQENQIFLASSLSELNEQTAVFDFIADNSVVNKVIDSSYGDTLFFTLNYSDDDTGESIHICVVTNKMYDFIFDHPEYNNEATVNGYKLQYAENYTLEDDIYNFKCEGEIITENEKLCIEYESYSFDEQSNFLNFLKGMLAE
jgi:hypothetical protein